MAYMSKGFRICDLNIRAFPHMYYMYIHQIRLSTGSLPNFLAYMYEEIFNQFLLRLWRHQRFGARCSEFDSCMYA
jgi:hypothetical protein